MRSKLILSVIAAFLLASCADLKNMKTPRIVFDDPKPAAVEVTKPVPNVTQKTQSEYKVTKKKTKVTKKKTVPAEAQQAVKSTGSDGLGIDPKDAKNKPAEADLNGLVVDHAKEVKAAPVTPAPKVDTTGFGVD